ncbi:hypothetical protein ATANTOWER_013255 [Ataeniobius toweri]|uniref:Uncharacterized protein n=1 Tax=Ataeniobius toweri TaxID=208326 RepID=A0ABU7BFT3_9TELE|nr:hypothetical protein [Ataeniobius toweri]
MAGFLTSCSSVLKSPSSCDFLPSSAARSCTLCVHTNIYTCTCTHTHTPHIVCTHSQLMQGSLFIQKGHTRILWGQGVCVLRFSSACNTRSKEKQQEIFTEEVLVTCALFTFFPAQPIDLTHNAR